MFGSMPLPRGVDREKAAIGYADALSGLPIEAIINGIRRFLRGEAEDLSPKFCPHPPELRKFIVSGMGSRQPASAPSGVYGYHQPRSQMIEHNLTKERAWQLIDGGVHPRGSIWCPGRFGEKPEIGDLFAPDEKWRGPFPLPTEKAA